MTNLAKWIWLPDERYPENQTCEISFMRDTGCASFCVAQFLRIYRFKKEISRVCLNTGGDTAFKLFLNGNYIENGPVCAGGDWIDIGKLPYYYTQRYEVAQSGNQLQFEALVQLGATACCDYSCGHGGFYLEGTVIFTDGSREHIGTDESWLCRLDRRYTSPLAYDESVLQDEFLNAVPDTTERSLRESEIPPLSTRIIKPCAENTVKVMPGESKVTQFYFKLVYAAYPIIETDGATKISVSWYEKPEQVDDANTYQLIFSGKSRFEALRFKSVGGVKIQIENTDNRPITVTFSARESYFPIEEQGSFSCSDEGLNRVYELCRHTLRICRQSIHLDSVTHQEMLACTGDYLIETKMTEFTYGDMRLSRLDVKRTADFLIANNGVLFHTTYSLLWVEMLYTVFEFTADIALLRYCVPALKLLFERFLEYTGENGLVERAPNYMFIDWLDIEGYTLHHPPKCLGQTALCMFYYNALKTAEKIYVELDMNFDADILRRRAESLKKSINDLLYDSNRGLYFDGLPTDNQVAQNNWLPANQNRKHFSRHSNVLAALYGVCNNAPELLVRALDASDLPDMQPYFMHYALSAIGKCGMFKEYGLPILERFKELEKECNRGLKEGWIAPAGYLFDYSHAWGGTPAYQLPLNFLGFRMIKPGFKEISLSPQLFGFESAEISMPSPYGMLRCKLHQGQPTVIDIPQKIKYKLC